MATPDDLEEFRSCQKTYLATAAPWNDMSRGAKHWIEGADEDAKTLGLNPVSSGVKTEDEGLFVVQHGYWQKAMQKGLEIEAAEEAEQPGRGQARVAADPSRTSLTTFPEGDPMAISLSEVEQFLYREARYLDDREFDKWLECYAPDCEFWMPAWDDDDTLVTDPQREISLIYYNNRGGLEDRVFRIKTDRSSATSLPEPRTSHNISNVEIVGQDGDLVEVRFNWLTLYYRYQNIDTYFGTSFYTLDVSGAAAADQEEEGHPEERLHPPRGRHLPRLTSGRSSGWGTA